MTRQEIENILPHLCNPFEGTWKCELVSLTSNDTYRQTNIASIIKYDYEKFIFDINDAINNNDDIKKGIINVRQLEHSLKIKHSVLAESIEWVYASNTDEPLSNLFFRFLSMVSCLATSYTQLLETQKASET